MRSKIPALTDALESRWQPHHSVVARRILAHIDFLEETIATLSDEIVERARTDSPWDDRYTDALGVLLRRRRRDGTWPVQNKHSGQVWFDMERTGQPSRWNTPRAMRVQRWRRRAAGL